MRRALIGMLAVVDIVDFSDSPWLGRPLGLGLANPGPIPCPGALGYVSCTRVGPLDPSVAWMQRFTSATGGLFDALPAHFAVSPPKPPKPFGHKRQGFVRRPAPWQVAPVVGQPC